MLRAQFNQLFAVRDNLLPSGESPSEKFADFLLVGFHNQGMVLQTVPQFLLSDVASKRHAFFMKGADQLFIKILRHGRELAARHHYKVLR